MSNIDLSKLITAEEKSAHARIRRALAVKAECRARILAVADETAQMNLAQAASAGLFDAGTMHIHRTGVAWVASMRRTCQALIDEPARDYREDAAWPAVPPGVRELSDSY